MIAFNVLINLCTKLLSEDSKFLFLMSFSKSGNMKQAEALLTEMESEGIEMTVITFEILIDGYANLQDESKCLYFFEKLKVNPRRSTYSGIIAFSNIKRDIKSVYLMVLLIQSQKRTVETFYGSLIKYSSLVESGSWV